MGSGIKRLYYLQLRNAVAGVVCFEPQGPIPVLRERTGKPGKKTADEEQFTRPRAGCGARDF